LNKVNLTVEDIHKDGVIAQLVEQWTENPCVAGSTPARTTSKKPQI
jgi:hypothetical protein